MREQRRPGLRERLARSSPTASLVVAGLSLVVALSSAATAAVVITGQDVRNGSLTGADVKNNSLRAKDLARNSVRSSEIGDGAVRARDLDEEVLEGLSGPQGPIGPAGKDGIDGLDGKDGEDGADGKQGEVGPAGPMGPPGTPGTPGFHGLDGLDGADGRDGVSGWKMLQYDYEVGPGTQAEAGVACPFGTKVLGGGGRGAPGDAVHVDWSAPVSETQWTTYFHNTSDHIWHVTVYAICADVD